MTEEDYVDTDEEQPGSCNGQGKFETWWIGSRHGETEAARHLEDGAQRVPHRRRRQDSKAPVTANCSSHWFDYRNGVAAVGWYEQGVRFLDVRNPRNIRQIGYYLPADGATWAAYWAPCAPISSTPPTRHRDRCPRIDARATEAATVAAPILADVRCRWRVAVVGAGLRLRARCTAGAARSRPEPGSPVARPGLRGDQHAVRAAVDRRHALVAVDAERLGASPAASG